MTDSSGAVVDSQMLKTLYNICVWVVVALPAVCLWEFAMFLVIGRDNRDRFRRMFAGNQSGKAAAS